ncbi:hypothetical protein ACFU39_25020 [Bacillus tropicus]|uniref:hypothetical protein n=1 Tax=Bacillus tropicus TaxID=2026188 RepID=UPI0035DF73CE
MINIPFCLIGLWACYKIVQTIQEEKHSASIDLLGNIYFTLSALLLLFGLSNGSKIGMLSIPTLSCIIVSFALLGLFILREKKTEHPIVNVSLFHSPAFMLPILATIGFGIASHIHQLKVYFQTKCGLSI